LNEQEEKYLCLGLGLVGKFFSKVSVSQGLSIHCLHSSPRSYNTCLTSILMMEVASNADSFSDGTRKFVTWFEALPGATFRSDLIAVEDLRTQNAGRGIGQ
jgi:hypothetical protein